MTLRTLVPSARSSAVASHLLISFTEALPTTRSETLIVIVVNASPLPLMSTDVDVCTLSSSGLRICGAGGFAVSTVKLRLAVSISWPSISAATSKEYVSSASAVGGWKVPALHGTYSPMASPGPFTRQRNCVASAEENVNVGRLTFVTPSGPESIRIVYCNSKAPASHLGPCGRERRADRPEGTRSGSG